MDRPFTEELDFDDNGLKNAHFQAALPEIASSDCTNENFGNGVIPQESSAAPTTEIETEQRKSDWKAPIKDVRGANALGVGSRTSSFVTDEQNKQFTTNDDKDSKRCADNKYSFEALILKKIEHEASENVLGRPREVETKREKCRSGRSAKDEGFLRSNTNLEKLSSLVEFCATLIATITSQLSIALTVGILILMPSVGVEGALASLPTNSLYVVGKTARMNCSTDLNRPVYWARTLAGSGEEQWLYYGINGFNGKNADGRYTIDKDEAEGRYDVIIADVQSKDAGQYVCVDDSGIGARVSAELIVSAPINCTSRIPSDGIMGSNVFGLEQGSIQVSCSLTYTGNLSPTLAWSWPGSEVGSDEPIMSVSTSSVTSTLKLSPTKERDNATFKCKANIEGATPNAVDMGLLWESETFSVKYAEFAAKEVDVCPGVSWNLFCNPQCLYHFDKKDEACQCIYTYHDSRTQQNYQVASYVVKCNDNDYRQYYALIGVAVGAAVLVAAITAQLTLKYFSTRKKMQRRPAGGSDESDEISNEEKSSAMLNAI